MCGIQQIISAIGTLVMKLVEIFSDKNMLHKGSLHMYFTSLVLLAIKQIDGKLSLRTVIKMAEI